MMTSCRQVFGLVEFLFRKKIEGGMNDKSSRRQSCYLVFSDLQQTPYQYYNI